MGEYNFRKINFEFLTGVGVLRSLPIPTSFTPATAAKNSNLILESGSFFGVNIASTCFRVYLWNDHHASFACQLDRSLFQNSIPKQHWTSSERWVVERETQINVISGYV